MKTITIYLLLILSFLFSQDDYYEFIITSEEPEFGLFYGALLSANSNELVFRTRNQQTSEKVSRIFKKNENEWVFIQDIPAINGIIYHQLDDDLFTRSDYGYSNDGRISFYERVDELWLSTGNFIINPDPINYDSFGNYFYRNGNQLITLSRSISNNARKIHIYKKINNSWYEEYTVLTNEESGGRLYIDDTWFAFGMIEYDVSGIDSNEGAVQFYKWTDSTWEEDVLLVSPEMAINGKFGSNVVLNENQLFIGNPYENLESGAIYVFNYLNNLWQYSQKITSIDLDNGDYFGGKVFIDDNYLVTNAWKNDDAGPTTGSVYVFDKDNFGEWHQIRKIIPSNAEPIDGFGDALSLNSNFIFASSPMKDNFSGAVYIYELEDFSLHSNFATYPVTGNAPLNLTFNDLSQGDPTAWQWDFDSDGIIDSEEQFPEHTYQFEGDFTVSLTVSNAEETSTFTKENYISVTGGLSYGDLNDDAIVNIIDILIMVDVIMGEIIPTATQIESADINNNGTIDIIDIVLVVNVILGE